ncbi:TonB-dependent receptor [Prosthecochloris sp. SCSIO W1101]|uniref:TonB-dependent receptor plug domain-containing protein n=1 Tax=Prosthecochloris sp. SCSIO W1101 TaxID=2992242 RepID=UPI00223E2BA6|nr:TonB-dependent receptor [Prosthecochloris sp. SCSIO W1101]UZJ40353.1 TonB-dependent receptor [Prosthecochloris sp. SCSIO W1101]
MKRKNGLVVKRMQRSTLLAGIMTCIAAFGTARADASGTSATETRLVMDEVIVTATMTEKSLEDVPGSVEVITAKEMKEMNASTVAQALENSVGLIVEGSSGRVKTPSIRGTRSKQSLILIDGRRIPVGFGDLVDINQIPVTIVERIEIVRGPSSSLYGSDAIGGVVNIITKKPGKKTGGTVTAQAGINEDGEGSTFLGSGLASGYNGRLSYIIAGDYRGSNKWNRTIDDGVDDGDHMRMGTGAGRFILDLTEGHHLSAGFDYSNRNMDGLRYIEGLTRDRDTEDKRLSYYLQYDAKLADNYQAMIRLNRAESTSEVTVDPPTSSAAKGGAKEDALSQAEARISGEPFKNHLVTLGTEFRKEDRNNEPDEDMDHSNSSVFIQDEFLLLNSLYFVAGARYDDNSMYGNRLTPRISFIYDVLQNVRIKGSYGQGFRAPSIAELFVESWKKRGKQVYEPNPNLNPEKSESYEVGIEGEYKNYRGSLTFFRNELTDMIDATYIRSAGTGPMKKDYYTWENISNAAISGLELESSILLPKGFSITGNATWMETENKETGKDLEGKPDITANLKLGYDSSRHGLHANLRASYIGKRFYSAGSSSGYSLFHAYVSKEITEKIDVFAGVDNIFDESESNPVFFYGGTHISL